MNKLLWLRKIVETILFASRWILPFFFFILMLALMVYAYVDVKEFGEYIVKIKHIDKNVAMLTFIELIDMTMIACLGKMIITGSYNSFVSKQHGYQNENITSGLLKVKMSTSLVGVTAIALLQRSVEIERVSWDTLYKLGFIHSLFLFASLVLEVVDYLHMKIEFQEEKFDYEKEKHEHIAHTGNHGIDGGIMLFTSNGNGHQPPQEEGKNQVLSGVPTPHE